MSWNDVKAMVKKRATLDCKRKQIWWAFFGENIGDEQNGKGAEYFRPVLVVKRFNHNLCFVVPLTSQNKVGKNFISFDWKKINGETQTSTVTLSQGKTISTKRLVRKIGVLKENHFKNILIKLLELLANEN